METRNECNRRTLLKTLGMGIGTACLAAPPARAPPPRKLKIGQTSINWGFRSESAEPGVRDSAKLGYWGYESYGDVVEAVEQQFGWGKLLDQYNIPMPSSYLD